MLLIHNVDKEAVKSVSSHLVQFKAVFKCLTAFESQSHHSLTGPSGAFRMQSVNSGENCLMDLHIWGGKAQWPELLWRLV